MFFRILYIIAGLLILYVGIDVMRKEDLFYYGYHVHLGKAALPVAIAIIIFGLGILFIAIGKSFSYNGEKYLVCPKCHQEYGTKDVVNSNCPECKCELEDLDGFYDRHPELKQE